MNTITRTLLAATGSLCFIGAVSAAEMAGADITKLISGKSVYLELTADSVAAAPGQGVIYYGTDGSVLYKTAKGVMWHGKWEVKGNTACVDWKESPNNPCTKYDKVGDTISIVNVATGKTRGKVIKVVDGNAEKLVP